jgi:SulP family sulfate permease
MDLRSIPVPKLVQCLREGYSFGSFANDLIAGVTVGLVALPLAMAFAIASGVPPQNGIYCAVIAGFTISALGGSRVQIGGPTGAFVVVVSGIVAAHGLDGLFMCTLMAGVILILLGVTGLGTAVKYIPRPVVIGFTNGIGVLIASTQVRDLFGLQTSEVPGEFLARMRVLVASAETARHSDSVRRCHHRGYPGPATGLGADPREHRHPPRRFGGRIRRTVTG